jgi:hypothetical protein
MLELHLHSPIRAHGVVLNELSRGQIYLYFYSPPCSAQVEKAPLAGSPRRKVVRITRIYYIVLYSAHYEKIDLIADVKSEAITNTNRGINNEEVNI